MTVTITLWGEYYYVWQWFIALTNLHTKRAIWQCVQGRCWYWRRHSGGWGGSYIENVLHIISVYIHACNVYHTFSVLLCCQCFFGEEDGKIIVRALHPKKLYLANCVVMSSIRWAHPLYAKGSDRIVSFFVSWSTTDFSNCIAYKDRNSWKSEENWKLNKIKQNQWATSVTYTIGSD